MVEKPLTAKIVSLLKEVIAILKDEKSNEEEEVQPIEPPKPEDDEETEDDKTEPIEPELNGGFAGF